MPPLSRLLSWLVARVTPACDRESVLGDLAEEYRERSQLDGRRAAQGWLRSQLVRSTWHGLSRRFEPTLIPQQGRSSMMLRVIQDARSAWRAVRVRPVFSAGVMVMLALGLGFNIALYAAVESALLRPLPYADAGRLVFIWQGLWPDGNGKVSSYPDYADLVERSRSFSSLSAYNISYGTLLEGGEAEQINGALVTTNFFETLGRTAMMGRTLQPGDEVPTENRPIVIAHSLWTRRFNQDPNILNRTMNFGGQARVIVGVMGPDFEQPEPFWGELTEYWTPMRVSDSMRTQRGSRYLRVIGRLTPDSTVDAAAAELTTIGDALRAEFGDDAPAANPVVRPFFTELVGDTRVWLLLCAAGATLVLVLAAGNIVNLLLANTAARKRELAVRTALGAGRLRLATQLICESLWLSVGGGLLGVAFATLILKGVLATGGGLARLDQAHVGASTWLFAAALSAVTGVVCGLWPALRVTGRRAVAALGSSRGATGLDVSRARTWLIAGETALAVPLVVGALLLAVTLVNLLRVDPGFDGAHAVHFRITLAGDRYAESDARTAFVRDLEDRLVSLPTIEHAGVVSSLPMGGLNNTAGGFTFADLNGELRQETAGFRAASSGYFAAMGIPLTRGRLFVDRAEDDLSVVVNERLAELFWPGGEAIGRQIKLGSGESTPWRTIVGVVGNVRHERLTTAAKPEVFWPYRTEPWTTVSVVAGGADPTAIVPQVRPLVASLDPQLPVVHLDVVADIVDATRGGARFSATAGVIFGGLALSLSAFGTFAVLSLLIGQRTREIGIRFALGATRGSVRALVLRDAMVPALAGCAVGTILATWLSRALASQVFGVTPQSPWVFAVAIGLLGVIAMLATWLPARRASTVDPALTLRAEV